MYLFLQNFRATLIPTIAVPVVLLGTFAVLAAFGFSINTLTMFGMVLAIGLLVDDAIVVVENVERVMAEEGLPPKEATRKSMGQIQALWSVSRWYCQRYSYRWPSLAVLLVLSIVSSLLPLFQQCAVGTGSVDPDSGSLCHHAETDCQRRSRGR